MVEREAELAIVDEALDQLTGPTPDAGGALLAFSGPAGLGKTTLLAELRRRAHARSCTVLTARGGEQEQTQPFHVARQLIQPQLAGTSEHELRAALGSWYSIVGPALGLCAPEQAPRPTPRACATASTGCSPTSSSNGPPSPSSSTTPTGPIPSRSAGSPPSPRAPSTSRCCWSSPTAPTNSPRTPTPSAPS
ncbi:hypothetical protein SF23_14450, partial [Streptomyces sp. MBRL 10]